VKRCLISLLLAAASMSQAVASTSTYRELVDRLKRRIRESQARAARALNTELVMLYWSIGRDILAQQQAAGWGDDIVGRIAEDLRAETGSARGFSRRNLFYMRRLAAVWPDAEKVQTLSAQIGWSHHQVLLDAWADQPELYLWYAAKAAENRWSVRHLQGQIALRLHERQGAALTNFAAALEPADADQALQATKDPYVFDFLELAEDAQERDLEQALIADIQKFLLELGTGFAFYGRQKAAARRRPGVLPRPPLLPPPPAAVRRHRAEGRQVPARVRLEDELLPQRRRRAAAPRRRP
jgi:predicted nuclease of restriction endonuclease-like (RecB) superfamily